MAKSAKNPWTPTDSQRREAYTMASYGLPAGAIAKCFGVSPQLMLSRCGTEFERGEIDALGKAGKYLLSCFAPEDGKVVDPKIALPASIFFLKARGGWRENTTAVEVSGGDKPIKIEVKDDRARIKRELEQMGARIRNVGDGAVGDDVARGSGQGNSETLH